MPLNDVMNLKLKCEIQTVQSLLSPQAPSEPFPQSPPEPLAQAPPVRHRTCQYQQSVAHPRTREREEVGGLLVFRHE